MRRFWRSLVVLVSGLLAFVLCVSTATAAPGISQSTVRSTGTTHHSPLRHSALSAVGADATTARRYVGLPPARIADTRPGSGQPYAGQTLAPGATLNVQVAGVGGVPTGMASAVVLNVTETGDTSATVIRVYPAGGAFPSASTLNPGPGDTVNNQTTVPLGTNGQISINNFSGSTGNADIIIDVEGYYAANGAGYLPITPTRISDTRLGSGQPDAGATLGPAGTLNLLVGGNSGIPANATAAVMDITVVNTTSAGYLTVYPNPALRPGSSTVNFTAGAILTKEATVSLNSSTNGTVTIYNFAGNTDVIIDVVGVYVTGAGDDFGALAPTRIADTRTGSGQGYAGQHLAAGGTLTIQAIGAGGVPAGATAVMVNLTVPNSTVANTYLTAYPAGTARPTSTSVYYTGSIAFTESTIKLDSGGAFTVYNHSGTTDVIVDVLGYFITPAAEPAPGICQQQHQDAVALLCADGAQSMYGYFITFIYPTPTYNAAPPSGSADLYDETNMITSDNLSGGIAIGLDMHYTGSETDYRPYWIDYTNHGAYNFIGTSTTTSDAKNHTFMVIPHCNGCTTWDVFYDFNLVGTTGTQPANDSFHISTGWDLSGISGHAGFSQTQNRIRFLDGNDVFNQFDPNVVSTLSPDGNCLPGVDPAYCFHFTTNISTVTSGSATTLSSWDVSKNIISPASNVINEPSSTAVAAPGADNALVAAAQHIVDTRLGRHR